MANYISAAAGEWRSGWTVVMAALVGYSYLSLATGSLSMFIEPLGDEFGWGRMMIASGFTVSAILTAILSPFVGTLVDRYGSRRIALPGIVATSFTVAAFSLASGSAIQWYVLWLIHAAISISVKTTVWTSAVAGIFDKGRGMALGVTLCGTAISASVLPPLSHFLIEWVGWRMAYVWLAFGWGAVTLIVTWLFLYDAHDRHAGAKNGKPEAGNRPEFPGLTIAEAKRDRALWRIAISTFVVMIFTIGFSVHQIPILSEAGVSRGNAALLAGLAGITAIAGKLITGVLLDRFKPNWIGGLTLGASAFTFFVLVDGLNTPYLIVVAILVNGYTQGTKVQIVTYLTARYGGMRNFGTIFGAFNSVLVIASGAGPVIAGLIFDQWESYSPFLIAGGFASILCGILLFTLPIYPEFKPAHQGEGYFLQGGSEKR